MLFLSIIFSFLIVKTRRGNHLKTAPANMSFLSTSKFIILFYYTVYLLIIHIFFCVCVFKIWLIVVVFYFFCRKINLNDWLIEIVNLLIWESVSKFICAFAHFFICQFGHSFLFQSFPFLCSWIIHLCINAFISDSLIHFCIDWSGDWAVEGCNCRGVREQQGNLAQQPQIQASHRFTFTSSGSNCILFYCDRSVWIRIRYSRKRIRGSKWNGSATPVLEISQ